MKNKRILTIDDLYSFYSQHKRSTSFSSEKSGYNLAVQVPFNFEMENETEENDGLLNFYNVRAFHLLENRNKSAVSREAAAKAMQQMAYKPILADFVSYVDKTTGETIEDFGTHAMEISDDGETINYIERQVGCFTADMPTFEEVDGKTYIDARIAIPNSYTTANDIIIRKGGTKVSVELGINELSYDAKTGILNLDDVDVMGMTLLGIRLDAQGNPIEIREGMEGAKISLQDFAQSKNSLFSSIDEEQNQKLIETLERLNNTLSNFNIQIEKGGNRPVKFEELLEKYSVKAEDVTFDYATMTDEELEAAFEEAFAENKKGNGSSNLEPEVKEGEEVADSDHSDETDSEEIEQPEAEESEDESEVEAVEAEAEEASEDSEEEDAEAEFELVRKFSLSHDDVKCALYTILDTSAEEIGGWAWIASVYDESFIYECNGETFRQSYAKENDVITFVGDRVQVFAEYLTAEERNALDLMRSTYAELKEFKDNYDLNSARSEKKEILANECYSSVFETAEFVELMKNENLDKFSKEEIEKEANAIVGKYAVKKFALESEKEAKPKHNVSVMFAAQQHESSFLEGLLAIGKARE